ncbi:MAG: hypothetical protein KIT79_14335 [Deltaproteobacteria bacterium]|nr:hypothetical protein [Deltaproteobacteria bacterium]
MKTTGGFAAILILLLPACAPKAMPFDAMDFDPEPAQLQTLHGGFLFPAGTLKAEIVLTEARQSIYLQDGFGNPVETLPERCRGLVIRRGTSERWEEFWFARSGDEPGAFHATELREAVIRGVTGHLLFRDCPAEGAADAVIRIDPPRDYYARHGGRVYTNADYLIEVVRKDDLVKFYVSTPEQPSIDVSKIGLALLYDSRGRSLPVARSRDGAFLYARVPARPGRGRLMFHLFNEELDLQVEW